MRHERYREAEMKARGVAHERVASGQIGVRGEGRLDIGEGGDDDTPDAFNSVQWQDTAMALHETTHHVGLARRPKRGTGFLRLLYRDQSLDDLPALHEKRVHGLVDAVDLATELAERGFFLARRFRHD